MPKWVVGLICFSLAGIMGFFFGAMMGNYDKKEMKKTIAELSKSEELKKQFEEDLTDSQSNVKYLNDRINTLELENKTLKTVLMMFYQIMPSFMKKWKPLIKKN